MNFLQLQYFLSVCKNLSFKKASDELFVSQPAISKQIAALEKELNTKLILRSRGNFLSITPEGEEYRKAFASIMETMRNADNNVHNKIPLSKTICRVGVMEGWDVFPFFRKSKQDIHRLYDEIEVIFERKAPDELNHDMLAGTLDFVIYIDAAFRNQKNYEFHTIGSLRSILYAAADYKAIKNGKIDPASIGEDYYYC